MMKLSTSCSSSASPDAVAADMVSMTTGLLDLPKDLMATIFSYVCFYDHPNLLLVNKRIHTWIRDDFYNESMSSVHITICQTVSYNHNVNTITGTDDPLKKILKGLKVFDAVAKRCILSDNMEMLLVVMHCHKFAFPKFRVGHYYNGCIICFKMDNWGIEDDEKRKRKKAMFEKAKSFMNLLFNKDANERAVFAYDSGFKNFAFYLREIYVKYDDKI